MINLSNRSINMLRNDNKQWYKGYVLWERDSEFQTYFALGVAFHSCMEARAKTWDYQLESNAQRMKDEFVAWHALDDYDKYLVQLHDLIENAKLAVTTKPELAEKIILAPINDKYQLKCKVDAIIDGTLVDYKTVTTLTSSYDDALEKYGQQAMLYMYANYKQTGEKSDISFIEILKKKQTLPRKKGELIAMLTYSQRKTAEEQKRKVEQIKNVLYASAKAEDVSQMITVSFNGNTIEQAEKLIKQATLKADRLQTLDYEDIL